MWSYTSFLTLSSLTPGQKCPVTLQQMAKCSLSSTLSGQLYWPRSKSYDYLFSDGEALLRNFPVQATINFYDESDSEEEEDSCDEDDDSDAEEFLKLNSHFTGYN
ncbi:hypothetical protein cypCar_00012007 [Cyprinus carpio]|nr:hypothetical protein cypCar_00012007 [Cyprinus carpio]